MCPIDAQRLRFVCCADQPRALEHLVEVAPRQPLALGDHAEAVRARRLGGARVLEDLLGLHHRVHRRLRLRVARLRAEAAVLGAAAGLRVDERAQVGRVPEALDARSPRALDERLDVGGLGQRTETQRLLAGDQRGHRGAKLAARPDGSRPRKHPVRSVVAPSCVGARRRRVDQGLRAASVATHIGPPAGVSRRRPCSRPAPCPRRWPGRVRWPRARSTEGAQAACRERRRPIARRADAHRSWPWRSRSGRSRRRRPSRRAAAPRARARRAWHWIAPDGGRAVSASASGGRVAVRPSAEPSPDRSRRAVEPPQRSRPVAARRAGEADVERVPDGWPLLGLRPRIRLRSPSARLARPRASSGYVQIAPGRRPQSVGRLAGDDAGAAGDVSIVSPGAHRAHHRDRLPDGCRSARARGALVELRALRLELPLRRAATHVVSVGERRLELVRDARAPSRAARRRCGPGPGAGRTRGATSGWPSFAAWSRGRLLERARGDQHRRPARATRTPARRADRTTRRSLSRRALRSPRRSARRSRAARRPARAW